MVHIRSRTQVARIVNAAVLYATASLLGNSLEIDARASASFAQALPASRVVARFPLQSSSARLEVTINGAGPFSFGLDTGASGEAWVTRALVKTLNLPTIDRMRVSDGSGVNSRDVETVRIDSLRVGNAVFERLRAPVLGDGPKEGDASTAYGTLGFELFRDYLVTLDYPHSELRVAVGQLPRADGRTVLPYSLESGTPYIDIDLADRRLRASLDSGSGGGLTLPRSFADSLPLRGTIRPAGKVASLLGVFELFQGELAGDMNIGSFAFHQPVVFFSDLVTVPTVGRNIMRSLVVTFDQRNQSVLLARP